MLIVVGKVSLSCSDLDHRKVMRETQVGDDILALGHTLGLDK